MNRETARREDETMIGYLMRLSAIVGECNVVESNVDGEYVPYATDDDEAELQRKWNAECASRFENMNPMLRMAR